MVGSSTSSGLGEKYKKLFIIPARSHASWKTQGISQPSWQRGSVTDPTIPRLLRFVGAKIGRWDNEYSRDGRGNSV
jgi:hypothetical protein